MTENNSPDRIPPTGSSQNAGSKRTGVRRKTGRVSQRRELAAVTLGAVAAITGLGGILAANPPSWATTAANAQSAVTTQATTTGSQSAPALESTIRVAPNAKNKESASAKDTSKKIQDKTGQAQAKAAQAAAQQQANEQAAAQQAVAQQATQQPAPVYSAPTQAPAGAVSQGS